MKTLGIIMIMLCSLMTGVYIYGKKKKEINALSEALSITELMIFELRDRNSGTNEIFEKIAARKYEYFVSDKMEFVCADNEVNRLTDECTEYLGKSDVNTQIAYINQRSNKIREMLSEKENEFGKRKRLYIELSLLFGVLLCIMLI